MEPVTNAAVIELKNADLDRVGELMRCYRLLGVMAKGELLDAR